MKQSEKLIEKILKFEDKKGIKPKKLYVSRFTMKGLKKQNWYPKFYVKQRLKNNEPEKFWGIELEVIK